ncbi:glycoside hydrolase family 2 protein [Chitinophaga arvensicola]|nr:sugar-binding domain-containing protein [Chitinophaga arvensicola]
MQSRWANEVSPENALKEYPRPQLKRNNWLNLNGLWDYTITDSTTTFPNKFDGKILVPYPIESALSGVQKPLLPEQRLWYKKDIKRPQIKTSDRILLNFGAVDWQATIYLNGKLVGEHSGGYQSFSFDVTDFLKPGNNDLWVKVYDPTDQGPNPHGKQVLHPANIYYTPSSGIWQTVWLETVPATRINHLKVTPDIDKSVLNVNINTIGNTDNTILEVIASANGKIISTGRKSIKGNDHSAIVNIPNVRLWSPDDPFLYDLTIRILKNNKPIDEIKSYFGMRKIAIQKDEKGTDRIFLNNKYTYNLGILDQGFWPEGLYTAPTDEALAFDIKSIKSLGFNTIRKHIKIEPERWYYHADKIGILVWQDFVNPSQDLRAGSKPAFEKEVQETMEQLHNHPSIVTWVLFNERWGSYDQQRLTEWVKKNDSSRIVNGHSGELLYVDNQLREPADNPWVSSDMTDVHSYPEPRLAPPKPNQARVLGEFGGVGVPVPGHEWDDMQGWGYVQVTPAELKVKYAHMMQELKELEKAGLSASIYTQPFDVEGEENGLLTYDRAIIKIPVNELRMLNRPFVSQTNGFNLDSSFSIAANMNLNDNDNRYDELMNEYNNGKRDSALLRRLILISIRKKDQVKTTKFSNDYADLLTTPFSKENLSFLSKTMFTSKDKGFELFLKNQQKVDEVLGPTTAIRNLTKIIEAEEITPLYTSKIPPDWDTVISKLKNKYGDLGEEFAYGSAMIYSGFGPEPKDWKNYGKYYVLYFEKALDHPLYHINNITWPLFEHVEDPKVLTFAAQVMKYALANWYQGDPEACDTYANLLHKLKQSGEAIKWEEKALQMKKGAPDEKIYADALQKMKSGLPTWPQNN